MKPSMRSLPRRAPRSGRPFRSRNASRAGGRRRLVRCSMHESRTASRSASSSCAGTTVRWMKPIFITFALVRISPIPMCDLVLKGFLHAVLDPSIKDEYVKEQWDSQYYKQGVQSLRNAVSMFDSSSEHLKLIYALACQLHTRPITRPLPVLSSTSSSTSSSAAGPSSSSASSLTSHISKGYGSSFLRKTLSSRVILEQIRTRRSNDTFVVLSMRFALTLWPGGGTSSQFLLLADLVTDLLTQHHTTEYPTLSRMARDYLAIQGSAVASGHAFSSSKITGTARRSRLNAQTFEVLQLLKDGYRTGAISASEQAKRSAELEASDDEEWIWSYVSFRSRACIIVLYCLCLLYNVQLLNHVSITSIYWFGA